MVVWILFPYRHCFFCWQQIWRDGAGGTAMPTGERWKMRYESRAVTGKKQTSVSKWKAAWIAGYCLFPNWMAAIVFWKFRKRISLRS